MSRSGIASALRAAGLFVLLGAGGSAGSVVAARDLGGADMLTILYSAETRGNLEPCACPDKPWGGLGRRVAFLQERVLLASERGEPVLVLDVGGFLPEGATPLRNDPEVAREYLRLLLDGLTATRPDAVGLDRAERAFLSDAIPDRFRALESAWLESGETAPVRTFPWGDRTIVLFAADETETDARLQAAARRAREAAPPDSPPYLILLARADALSGRRLARETGAELVLLSRGARPRAPLHEGGSILLGCGAHGKELGEARLVRRGAAVELLSHTWHPMDATVAEEPAIERRVRDLLARDGVSLRAMQTAVE